MLLWLCWMARARQQWFDGQIKNSEWWLLFNNLGDIRAVLRAAGFVQSLQLCGARLPRRHDHQVLLCVKGVAHAAAPVDDAVGLCARDGHFRPVILCEPHARMQQHVGLQLQHAHRPRARLLALCHPAKNLAAPLPILRATYYFRAFVYCLLDGISATRSQNREHSSHVPYKVKVI